MRRFGSDLADAANEIYGCSPVRLAGEAGLLVANLLFLVAISSVVLANHSDMLLSGLDGAHLLEHVKEQHVWMPFGPQLGLNPLQGGANIFNPVNTGIIFTFLLQNFFFDGEISKILTFTLFSIELFLGTYVAFRLLRVGQLPALAACWGLTLLAFPYFWPALIYPIFGLIPYLTTLIVGQGLVIATVYRIGKGSLLRSVLLAAFLFLLAAYLTAAFPVHVMLLVPAVLYSAGCFLLSRSRRELLVKIAACFAVLLALYLGGFVEAVLGNLLYSAPTFFSDEMIYVFTTLYSASTLFQGASHALAPYLFVLNLAGAALVGVSMRGDAGRLAWVHLSITLLCLGAGLLFTQVVESYRGPMIVYFEIFLWPFYFLYGATLILSLAVVLVRLGRRAVAWRWPHAGMAGRPASALALGLGVVVMGLPWIAVPLSFATVASKWYLYPPDRTAIVDELAAELAIRPGTPFRGSVATFTGTNGEEAGIDWFEQHSHDYDLVRAVGNDHRLVGLWYYGIPTLQEYSQVVTPQMYLVASRLLARPQDRQVRNIMVLTRVNEGLLRSLGVRFVVTDHELARGFRLRERLEWDRETGRSLYLYELPAPNLGGYSPTEPVRIDDAGEALLRMMRGIDYTKQVLVEAPLQDGLVPATDAEMVFEQGGLKVRASSSGVSMLLLPIQYSSCLEMRSAGTETGGFRLIRANLLQAAIVFENLLDVEIAMAIGPLGDSTCRLRDYRELKAFGIEEAARAFPLDVGS